jgi:hypothetical protein
MFLGVALCCSIIRSSPETRQRALNDDICSYATTWSVEITYDRFKRQRYFQYHIVMFQDVCREHSISQVMLAELAQRRMQRLNIIDRSMTFRVAYIGCRIIVHQPYEPRYVTPCVGNLTEEKSLLKCVGTSHRRMYNGSMLKIASNNFLWMV